MQNGNQNPANSTADSSYSEVVVATPIQPVPLQSYIVERLPIDDVMRNFFIAAGLIPENEIMFDLLNMQGNLQEIYTKLEAAFRDEDDFLNSLEPGSNLYEKRLIIVLHYYLFIKDFLNCCPSQSSQTLTSTTDSITIYREDDVTTVTLNKCIHNDVKIPSRISDYGYIYPEREKLAENILSYQGSLKALLLNIAMDDKSDLYNAINEKKPIVDALQQGFSYIGTFFRGKPYQSYLDQLKDADIAMKKELFSTLQNQGFIKIEAVVNKVLLQNSVATLV